MSRVHSYQVTLAPLPHEGGAETVPALVFTHHNHDDLMQIAERVRRVSGLDPDSAAATAVGLKLLGGVMLSERDNPLFDVLRQPLREFIQELKSLSKRS
ncbi:DUF3861 domain-containing protein [Pseudomonas sp. 2FG]|uniref:DUF3861 domain-containing protein n=1 Tax=Pseudomonas sp. 2FG TaxID=2502191 RepID=UPI001C4984DE|nr:DUF3861 domain-containing protein [Pseudomonas sp. 2FG]